MHDPRLGRFFAVDPLSSDYPHYTPYSFSGNKVIANIELEGLEEYDYKLTFDNQGSPKLNIVNVVYTRSVLWGLFTYTPRYSVTIEYQEETYEFTKLGARVHGNTFKKLDSWMKTHTYEFDDFFWSNTRRYAEIGRIVAGYAMRYQRTGKLFTGRYHQVNMKQKATKNTQNMINKLSKNKTPRKITTIVDGNTGKEYVGVNGRKDISSIHKKVQKNLPKNSKEKWSTTQCAEVDALNKLAKDGGVIGGNTYIYTHEVKKSTGTYVPIRTCKNCTTTSKRTSVVSNEELDNK